jgi:hypothetical protein
MIEKIPNKTESADYQIWYNFNVNNELNETHCMSGDHKISSPRWQNW